MNTDLTKILVGDEQVIIKTSPSKKATLLSVALFIIIGFILLFLLIGPIFWILAVAHYITEMSRLYVVTNKRVISRHGVLSPQITSVNLNQITDVTVSQNFGEHLIDNIGNIRINTAGSGVHEMIMKNVSDPHSILQKINELRG